MRSRCALRGAGSVLVLILCQSAFFGCPYRPEGSRGSPRFEQGEAVSRLDVHIDTVVSGGHWCRGEEEGYYRVIVYSSGIEEVYHHLYIQLVRVDRENANVVVDRTRPVKEAQGLDIVFSNLTLVPADSAACSDALVEADVSRRLIDGERSERFWMRINAVADYQLMFEPTNDAGKQK